MAIEDNHQMVRELTPMPGFCDLDGHTWLNTAHQGALPQAAAEMAGEAIKWKTRPFELTRERFRNVPEKLRAAIARLLNVASADVILANSASYGLHLLVHGFPWREGDEVIVLENDFPSDILPWLILERRVGLKVTRLRPRYGRVEPGDLKSAITSSTRLFCATWVNSLTGIAINLERFGKVCRDHGIVFLVNGSQALGAHHLDLSGSLVDAFTCAGFKWLCGPYGTGFIWMTPALRERMLPTKAYWLSVLSEEDLESELGSLSFGDVLSSRHFDVFGTANFFNYTAFTAAIEHLLNLGIENISRHDQTLVSRFIDGLDSSRFIVLSPQNTDEGRSTLIYFSHKDKTRNESVHRALQNERVHIAARRGLLRLSPHLYNSSSDIDRALQVINQVR